MANSALDRQIKTALCDDQNAEKFAEHIADLAAQISTQLSNLRRM
jgi:hypothetical protein